MKRTLIVAAAVLALAGCGTSAKQAAVKPTPVAASSTQPSARPSATGPVLHKLGTTVTLASGEAKVTAYAYRQPSAHGAPAPDQAGYTWGSAEVKVCVNVDSSLSPDPWTLVYADNSSAEVSSTGYDQFPLPVYDYKDFVHKGRCQRGWITYPVPKDKRPVLIEYALGDGSLVDWKI